MADEDTKIKDIETKSSVKDEAPKVDEPKVVEAPKGESFADIIKDVESKSTVRESVETLAQHLALEAEAKASEGKAAIEAFAGEVSAAAGRFAGAVEANVAKSSEERGVGGEKHYGTRGPSDSAPRGRGLDLTDTNLPDNTAAVEAAVAHGVDEETAIKMTSPGSNT